LSYVSIISKMRELNLGECLRKFQGRSFFDFPGEVRNNINVLTDKVCGAKKGYASISQSS